MAFFSNLLNTAANNVLILFPDYNFNLSYKRRLLLKELALKKKETDRKWERIRKFHSMAIVNKISHDVNFYKLDIPPPRKDIKHRQNKQLKQFRFIKQN